MAREKINGLIKANPHNLNYKELYDMVYNIKGVFKFQGFVETYQDLLDTYQGDSTVGYAVYVIADRFIYRSDGTNWVAVVDLTDFQVLIDEGYRVIGKADDKIDDLILLEDEVTANESTRIADENTRKTNETARISQASSFATAENARQTNEAGRVTAEIDRNNQFTQKMTDLSNTSTAQFNDRVVDLENTAIDHENRIEDIEATGVPFSDTALKLATARTITLSGDATGSISFDGSQNVIIPVEVTNDSHSHDGRYYTESEVNSLLGGKSSNGHIHDDRYYTESEVNSLLGQRSPTGHNHDDKYYSHADVQYLVGQRVDWISYSNHANNGGIHRNIIVQSSTPPYQDGAIWIKI